MEPSLRYRLDPGERFAVVGTVDVRCALDTRLGWEARLAHVEARYVVDCEVVEDHGDGTVSIACALRELRTTVRSPFGRVRVPGREGRSFSAAPWLRAWARSLAGSAGSSLVVRKGLSEDLLWVAVAEPLRRAFVGRWAALGLPISGEASVDGAFRYRLAPAALFAGQRPMFAVDRELTVVPRRVGPLRLDGGGVVRGWVVADATRGTMARSVREGRVALALGAGRRALARLLVDLRSDTWHEGHPPQPAHPSVDLPIPAAA